MKKNKLKEKSFWFRLFAYLRRGYAVYIAFIIGAFNFVVIQYRLLIEYVPFLKTIFPRMTYFIIFVAIAGIPITILVGWWDYKRGVWKEESKIQWVENPAFKALKKDIDEIKKKLDILMSNTKHKK